MKSLLVLVGVQGSGKTTVLNGVTDAVVLKPSTQRAPRFQGESEYHFEQSWNNADFAWTITKNGVNYGLRKSELARIEKVGITVFDPAALNALVSSGVNEEFEVVKIGLNTIKDAAEQNQRVSNAPNRTINQNEFEQQTRTVLECDAILSGKASEIISAVNEIARILGGRGGILTDQSIRRLIAAGTLLENCEQQRIETASYDLRLADKYWCQGSYHELTPSKQSMTIPAYSFVLVTSIEQAIFPSFIAGSFDIRVKLFLSGVSLSNGPQVDPGYRGALLCMLYNASGTPVYLNRGDHFATLQFQTTATNSRGYNAHYQGKKTFEGFVDARTAHDPGGRIREDLEDISITLKKEMKEFKNFWWVVMGVVIAAIFGLAQLAYSTIDKANQATEKITDQQAKIDSMLEKVEKGMAKLDAAFSPAGDRRVLPKGGSKQ